MEIVIGSIPPLPPQSPKVPPKSANFIVAQLLHVRAPRKGIAGPSGRERRHKQAHDPIKGKVLTILIPDGSVLPPDIATAKYDVNIRFVRK